VAARGAKFLGEGIFCPSSISTSLSLDADIVRQSSRLNCGAYTVGGVVSCILHSASLGSAKEEMNCPLYGTFCSVYISHFLLACKGSRGRGKARTFEIRIPESFS
jgi:hypothetical protein